MLKYSRRPDIAWRLAGFSVFGGSDHGQVYIGEDTPKHAGTEKFVLFCRGLRLFSLRIEGNWLVQAGSCYACLVTADYSKK